MAHLLVLSLLLNYFVLYIECEELGFCEAEKCANIQPLKEWFEKIKDPQLVLKSNGIEGDLSGEVKPLVEIVPCDSKNALWNYKYTGSKGKRKIFTGKGKLIFLKVKDPPHGYDYGMKSGHCLIKNDDNLKSIEGEFDDKGRLQGVAKIDYFDNKRIFGQIRDGVLHGIARWAIKPLFSNLLIFLRNFD